MPFADEMQRNGQALDKWARAIHKRVADIAFGSIVEGSSLTGAPGQPVAAPIYEKAGALKASWQETQTAPNVITIATDFGYAPTVEDNLKGVRFRSGGPHGVKLTVLAADRIVDEAVRQVGSAAK